MLLCSLTYMTPAQAGASPPCQASSAASVVRHRVVVERRVVMSWDIVLGRFLERKWGQVVEPGRSQNGGMRVRPCAQRRTGPCVRARRLRCSKQNRPARKICEPTWNCYKKREFDGYDAAMMRFRLIPARGDAG